MDHGLFLPTWASVSGLQPISYSWLQVKGYPPFYVYTHMFRLVWVFREALCFDDLRSWGNCTGDSCWGWAQKASYTLRDSSGSRSSLESQTSPSWLWPTSSDLDLQGLPRRTQKPSEGALELTRVLRHLPGWAAWTTGWSWWRAVVVISSQYMSSGFF